MKMYVSSILRCPISKRDLVPVGDKQIARLNQKLANGRFCHVDGTPVRNRVRAALASSDGKFMYPIKDDVIGLLPSLAIVTKRESIDEYGDQPAIERSHVKNFYDHVGWRRMGDGAYEDAARFEDRRAVSRDYVRECHLRVNQYIASSGTYLLDIASGPVQYPEYLTYSSGYDYRICADISLVALQEARERLGERGIYLLCDIRNIPLKSETVDAFVSLHTVYHVPADGQLTALEELHRVLKDGRSGVVVYSWGDHAALMMPLHPVQTMKWALRRLIPASALEDLKKSLARGATDEPPLYFHAQDFEWYRCRVVPAFNADLASWRSVSVSFLRRFIHESLFGKRILALVFWMEGMFPRFFGRFGQYPMFIFRKY